MRRVIGLAVALALVGAGSAEAAPLTMHRAKVAIRAYAGKPAVRLKGCERLGARRVGCWVHGTCSECGAGWYFDFWTRATLRRDGHVWVAFDAFEAVRM